MNADKKFNTLLRLIILLAVAAAIVGLRLINNRNSGQSAEVTATKNVSSMQGYVSRYNPGHISSAEAWGLMKADANAVMLDVRSAASYDEYRVSVAANVPPETISDYVTENIPDKDRTIICYCFCGDQGGPALSVYNLLTDLGYTNVYYTEPDAEWTYEGTKVTEPPANEHTHKVITGAEAKDIYDTGGAFLLDVRSQEEYDEKHIDGSVLIPVAVLESRLFELPDKGTAIIVYCRSGGRSKSACDILFAAGYTNVYDMQAVDSWPGPLTTQ